MYKQFLIGKKAVCFDMDGTFVYTIPLWNAAFSRVLSVMGAYNVPHEKYTGFSLQGKWNTILSDFDISSKLSAAELTSHTEQEFLRLLEMTEDFEPTAGFFELVTDLKANKKLKIVLASNAPKYIVDAVLKKVEVSETFDLVVTGNDVKSPKPDPEIYKLVMSKLSISAKELLVFEDSVPGAQAAVAAKATVFVIWDGKILKNSYPEEVPHFFQSFDGLAGSFDYDLTDRMNDYADRLKTYWESKGKKPDGGN